MTAFAAIVTLGGNPHSDSRPVSASLGAIAGAPTRAWRDGPCELLFAPLHPWDPREALILASGRFAVAGQLTLEAPADLAGRLQLPVDASEFQILGAAFERWGEEFARQLRGEYACAVWDARARRLTCARDPLGIRPLYVGAATDVVIVSNTIDAVVAHPSVSREPDRSALARFLAFGRLTSAVATPYRAVRMVPDGHTLTIGCAGASTLERHWQPPPPRRSRADERALVHGYLDVLGKAVRDRVRNRRCAVFLSGGMDSTSLAAIAVEHASEMRALTFAYNQLEVPAEVALARSVANRLSIPFERVDADADRALEAERTGELPALPVDEPALTNWRAGLRRAASFSTLALYGEDGDALFAPTGGRALRAVQSLPSIIGASIHSMVSQQRLPYLGLRLRERLGWHEVSGEHVSWLTHEARRLADEPEESRVFGLAVHPADTGPRSCPAWERLLRNVPQALSLVMSPDVTRQRLALTLPLMDTRLIEFVASVSPLPWRQNKRLARTAFAGRLPEAVLRRDKTPVVGRDAALVRSWRDHCLTTARVPDQGAAVGEFVDSARWLEVLAHGSPRATMAAWRAMHLGAWLARTERKVAPCTA